MAAASPINSLVPAAAPAPDAQASQLAAGLGLRPRGAWVVPVPMATDYTAGVCSDDSYALRQAPALPKISRPVAGQI